ncbi:MAG: hypothetical protein WCW52_06430 [Elusimicrobiales bacterium]|jgi:hypothetical protein
MKRISSKATVYLVDGSNFSRSFQEPRAFSAGPAAGGRGGGDELETEFLDWLDSVSRLELLGASCFRVVFDGGFRSVRRLSNPAVNIYFSEHESADELLLERACFLAMEGVRCLIVSNDREIREKSAGENIMSMPCDVFYRLCEAELKKSRK